MATEKTDTPVDIPIAPELDTILKKHDYSIPEVSEPVLNRNIKTIARQAGIDAPVQVVEYKNGLKTYVTKEKCTQVTTHTARRSGATNMYKAGLPSLSIMKITGHTTEKAFLRYICIDREENAEMLYENKFFGGNLKVAK
jgi:integrase